MSPLQSRIFQVTKADFDELAMEVYRHQYNTVPVYRQFCDSLQHTPQTVRNITHIPFLPVEFFKQHTILAEGMKAQTIFESSGTTGSVPSKHHVTDTGLYAESFTRTFELFYGNPADYAIIAMLPSYVERGNSSLVWMAKQLIAMSKHAASGFLMKEHEQLKSTLEQLQAQGQKTILLGVTFALLDFVEAYRVNFPELIVMETGGMKGRREELTRAEVHERLCAGFGVSQIHSEYGMTELLSQSYSKGNGIFQSPPWMKIVLRDMYDPLQLLTGEKTGAVNVIDLANLYSCSFIATSDIGRVRNDNTFEILGRVDHTDVRGCNLMYV